MYWLHALWGSATYSCSPILTAWRVQEPSLWDEAGDRHLNLKHNLSLTVLEGLQHVAASLFFNCSSAARQLLHPCRRVSDVHVSHAQLFIGAQVALLRSFDGDIRYMSTGGRGVYCSGQLDHVGPLDTELGEV